MITDQETVTVSELDADRCWKLLGLHTVGRVGFTAGDEQIILPVNYVVDRRYIVIRTGQTVMHDVLGHGATVAFEVDHADEFSETGWSVLIKGFASEIADVDQRHIAERLPLHSWMSGPGDCWIRMVPRTVTGRVISRHVVPEGRVLPYMPPD